MLSFIVIWGALLVALVVFAVGRTGRGGALTLAYFLTLSLIHVPGVLPFLWQDSGLPDGDETLIGFEMTVFGMAAFVSGSVLARWVAQQRDTVTNTSPSWRARAFAALSRQTFSLGIVAYFVLVPLSGHIPSGASIASSWATLLIIGLWLALYSAAVAADRRRTLATLGLLPMLPLATLVTGGFLGYGVAWVVGTVAFLFVITRHRVYFYVAALPALFLGLSLFVTYMGQRAGIREVVWYEQSGIFDRLERVSALITDFQFLDLASPDHVAALDGRLNQNALAGAAIMYHEEGAAPFAYGATIPVWALIPRAVWPDKPDIGGSGDIVSRFTGIRFAQGTSIGAGQVLEFYVNFGVAGVLVGFFGLGCLLTWLDQGIMRAFATDDLRGLLLRAMPGLMLLQPGGSLLEILVGFVAAYVGARLVLSLKFFNDALPARSRRLAA